MFLKIFFISVKLQLHLLLMKPTHTCTGQILFSFRLKYTFSSYYKNCLQQSSSFFLRKHCKNDLCNLTKVLFSNQIKSNSNQRSIFYHLFHLGVKYAIDHFLLLGNKVDQSGTYLQKEVLYLKMFN